MDSLAKSKRVLGNTDRPEKLPNRAAINTALLAEEGAAQRPK
jgi:hypothetical protein